MDKRRHTVADHYVGGAGVKFGPPSAAPPKPRKPLGDRNGKVVSPPKGTRASSNSHQNHQNHQHSSNVHDADEDDAELADLPFSPYRKHRRHVRKSEAHGDEAATASGRVSDWLRGGAATRALARPLRLLVVVTAFDGRTAPAHRDVARRYARHVGRVIAALRGAAGDVVRSRLYPNP